MPKTYSNGLHIDYNHDPGGNLVVRRYQTFVDSDRDGMEDTWEMNFFKTLVRDGKGDFDGDEARAPANDLLDLDARVLEVDAHRLEDLGGDARAFPNQPQQDLLGAHKVVAKPTSFFLGQHDDLNGLFCEAFKHDGINHLVRAG